MTEKTDTGRGWHDMGGLEAGAIDPAEHDYALWEKRVDALKEITGAKGLFTVDGLRRAIEDLGPEAYDTMSYYDRWVASIARNLVEAGVFTAGELGTRMDEIARRGETYGAVQQSGQEGQR